MLFTLRVRGEELGGELLVVLARHARADAVLHEAREGGQARDGRIDALLEQLAVEDDLALGDVAGEVGDGVRDVVVGHGEDGDLRDGALGALDLARPLVQGGEVGVQVARDSPCGRDLAADGGDLAQRLAVVRHVRHDDQHVHVALVGEVLGRGQRAARRDEALDGGVVGEGEEHDDVGENAAVLEGVDEEARHVVLDAHGGEDDDEGLVGGEDLRLADDLRGEPVVRQAVAGEDGQLLAADQGVHPVDAGDAGLDEVPGVGARGGVDGHAVHVQAAGS